MILQLLRYGSVTPENDSVTPEHDFMTPEHDFVTPQVWFCYSRT